VKTTGDIFYLTPFNIIIIYLLFQHSGWRKRN